MTKKSFVVEVTFNLVLVFVTGNVLLIFILILVLIRIIMRHTIYSCGCIQPRKRFKFLLSISNTVYLSRLLSNNTEVR